MGGAIPEPSGDAAHDCTFMAVRCLAAAIYSTHVPHERDGGMRRLALVGICVLAGVVGLVLLASMVRQTSTGAPRATARPTADTPPVRQRGAPVEVTTAREERATGEIRAVGSLRSDESVQIAPEIAGRIAEILFNEGEQVQQGDALVKLDDALTRAEIAEAEARYDLTKANIDRANALARTGNVTERARDEAVAAFETARAALELARVRLAKHTLIAPFPGTVGLRSASVGAFVPVGTPIVNLEKMDQLKIDFKVPELHLSELGAGQEVQVTVDALPAAKFTGTIYAIDPLVDANGRALQIRARLANADGTLRPGLFARIAIQGRTERRVVVVPESAVTPRGGETFVYRVQDGKAAETKVRLGERKGGNVQIIEGLDPGATVVTAGQQRLRDGAVVEIVAADNRAAPG
jgi:membrane fusion protein, multidrug efflux system